MKEIKALEQMLGEGYTFGPVPRIRKNNWLNRCIDYVRGEIKEKNKFRLSFLLEGIKNDPRKGHLNSAYYSDTHTILINSREELFHELVHAYTRNQNPEFYERGTNLMQTFLMRAVQGKLLRKDIEELIMSRAIIEGIAYYLEGEYRKQGAKPGTNPASLPTKKAKSFYKSGEKLTRKFLKISRENLAVKREQLNKGMMSFSNYTAYAGSYLARSWCEAYSMYPKGMIINNMMREIPNDIKDLQEIILYNMKISAKLKKSN
jgi:hypothetical protein